MKKLPENLVPLVYLVTVAAIAGILQWANVPELTIGGIIGAGLTRIKLSAEPPVK